VPLKSRVDDLRMRGGKSVAIPFEAWGIFSMNLEPEELIDPAFLGRLPYKLEVRPPPRPCTGDLQHGVPPARAGAGRGALQLHRAAHRAGEARPARDVPAGVIEQTVATCRAMGPPPHLEERCFRYALDNLRVLRSAPPKVAAHATQQADPGSTGRVVRVPGSARRL
jgi:hypothetical protein